MPTQPAVAEVNHLTSFSAAVALARLRRWPFCLLMLSTYCLRRNGKLLLLLAPGLLAGCGAERVAFRLQPVPVQHASCQPVSPPAPGNWPLVSRHTETAKPRQWPVAVARRVPRVRPAQSPAVAKCSAEPSARTFRRAAHWPPSERRGARATYWGHADTVAALFLFCLVGGPLCLIVALAAQLWVLAAIGAAMLLLAFTLFKTYPRHK